MFSEISQRAFLPFVESKPWSDGPSAPAAKAVTPQSQAEEVAIASALLQIESEKSDYHISNADLVNVSVLGEEDMSRQIRVSQSGTITYPLICSVKVGGLSTSQAGGFSPLAAPASCSCSTA